MTAKEPPSKDLPYDDIEAGFEGKGAAFRRFYLHYDPTVRWAVGLRVYRWPKLVPLFDDIVQEVWTRLIRRNSKLLRYYRKDSSVPFSRFLSFIAARLGWRLAKKNLEYPEVGLEEVPEVPADDALGLMARMLRRDFLEKLMKLARERLDDKDLALLEGYYVVGEPIREIALRLEINENAAYQRHRRLLKKLADIAKDLVEEPAGAGADLVAVLVATALLLGEGGLGVLELEDEILRPQAEVTRE